MSVTIIKKHRFACGCLVALVAMAWAACTMYSELNTVHISVNEKTSTGGFGSPVPTAATNISTYYR